MEHAEVEAINVGKKKVLVGKRLDELSISHATKTRKSRKHFSAIKLGHQKQSGFF